ncbi:hypothetical protein HK100_012717 [Physocladia obscura]|uniref:sn-1-specific diacylglycerol lipase n=1 Tax=Physocladia obscura TaxID=109957 RepID=A0AAD5TAM0_9FUNG|nr:hypothetical protein HK100_012717 [Physocladia obscura]
MSDGSEVFQTYEREYAGLHDAIRTKLSADIPGAPSAEHKKRLINQTIRELEEADEIVCLFPTGAALQSKLQPRVRSFKEEIKSAKKDLSKFQASDREQLLGGSASGANLNDFDGGGSSNQRAKMLQGTERLQEGSRRLEEARQMALDTEAMGIDTLGNLNQQREQILKTKDRLTVADSFITKSQGVLRGMHETLMANKFLTYGIIAALILLILIVVYFKCVSFPALPDRETIKLVLKLRKDSKWINVTSDENGQSASDVANFVLTFHSHMFDSLKIDLYSVSAKLLVPRARHHARGRTDFSEMVDWQWGNYSIAVDLFPLKKRKAFVGHPEPIARLELHFSFTPLLSQGEEIDSVTNLKQYLAKIHIDGTSVESNSEDQSGDDSSSEFSKPVSSAIYNIETRKQFLRASTYREVRESVLSPQSHVSNSGANNILLTSKNSPSGLRMSPEPESLEQPIKPAASPVARSGIFSIPLRSKSIEASSTSPPLSTESRPTATSKLTERAQTLIQKTPTISKPRLISSETRTNMNEVSDLVSSLLKNNFDMPFSRAIKVTQFLYKFENEVSVPRHTGDIIKNVTMLKEAQRFMDHSLVVYGAAFAGFCNGSISLKDNLRSKADEKTAIEDYTKRSISTTRYYIMHDTAVNAIVISVQGTVSGFQLFTDLNADYFPGTFNGINGSVHKGILRSAQAIIDAHFKDIIGWCKSLNVEKIVCTGHSLGAGTASLLAILFTEQLEKLKEGTGNPNFIVIGRCFASPGTATTELAKSCSSFIDCYVMENDIVPRLSFGSFYAFKELMFKASDILDQNLTEAEAFERLQVERTKILEANKDKLGMIPGTVYHLYKTVRRIPRRHQVEKAPLFKEAFKTVALPENEQPERPHYVVEKSLAEYFAYVAPRRHLLNHHMPWQYTKAIAGALQWIVENGQ